MALPIKRPFFPIHLVLVFVFLASLIFSGGAWFYLSQEHQLRDKVEAELISISRSKVSRIMNWRAERLANASQIMDNPFSRRAVIQWLNQPGPAPGLTADLVRYMGAQARNYHYSNVILVDASGRVRLSLSPTIPALQGETLESFQQALREGKPVMSDLTRHEKNDYPHQHLIAPFFQLQASGKIPAGAMVIVIDAREFLFPLVQSWPLPSRSAETLLVRREGDQVVFLNELRHRKDTALRLKIPLARTEVPAVMAVLGKQGVVLGRDYRGVPVISMLRPIPECRWFMIAKKDQDEAFADLRLRLRLTLMLTLVIFTAVTALAAWLWQSQQKDYYKLVYQAELERRALLAHFQHLVKYANDIILLADAERRLVEANDRAVEVYGYTREELLRLNLEDLTPANDRAHAIERVRRVLEKGAWVNESLHQRKDGSLVPVEVSGRAMLVEGHWFIVGIVRDITERRKVETALRESEERYRGLFEHMTEGFAYCRMLFENGEPVDWIYLSVNEAFPELTGLRDIVGKRVTEAIPGIREADPVLFTTYGRVAKTGNPEKIEVYVKALDMWFSISVYCPGPEHFVAVFEVITERKRAEAALRASEEKYRRLHESMLDAFVAVDMSGRIIECNRAFEQMLGYSREELRDLSFRDLTPSRWHDMENALIREKILPQGRSGVYEKEYCRRDGSVFPVELSVFLVRDETERPSLMWAIVRDISERKLAEEKIYRLNLELEQRVRERTAELQIANQELESFAYSVSHDLRAPLRGIDGFGKALLEDCGGALDEKGRHYLDRIRAATQHMGRLIDDLLRLSQVTRAELRRGSLDLGVLVQRIAEEMRQENPGRTVDLPAPPPAWVQADAGLMRIALENLLANAWKFTARREDARVDFGVEDQNGEKVYFLKDNGAGFDMAYASKLFGVFQRLHSHAEFPGTGIGLATVARIIRRHGGRIWAQSAEGQGAVFYFTLPEVGVYAERA